MAKTIRGLQRKDEISSRLERRDVRPFKEKFMDMVETGEVLMISLVFAIGALFIFPQVIEIIAIVAILFFRWASKQQFTLSFRLPITADLPDHNDPKPGQNVPEKARGIAFLGNEMDTNRELWFNKSDMCTHILVFGSTGAGKALQDSEPVFTPSGWRRIDTLKVGDQIFTPDRQITTVTDIFPQGLQPLWELKFDDGRSIAVTPDHLWGVAKITSSDSWKNIDQPSAVSEVLSTDELEQRLFERTDLNVNEAWAIPLVEAVGDTVTVWEDDVDTLYAQAQEALLDSTKTFPTTWTEGSVKQREQTWARLKKTAKAVGPVYYFDSSNLSALQAVQSLAHSLGFWAALEEWNNAHTLVIKTHLRWLKISSITPLHTEEECRCIKIADPQGLFITKDWLVTHNTETLISMAFNTLVTGSGFIYVDGKGDNGLWAKIFGVVRYLGREDDLLVINFMTGGADMSGPQKNKASNTMNPFIVGSAAGLTELLVGLMDEAGGDNAMWKGRAISLISSIMLALVHLRDHDGLLMGVEVIRDHLLLEKIQQLSKRRDLPQHVLQSLKAYLRSLPGYQENAPKQSETVMDQHGYLQMQFTRILGSLADIYGYIFKTNLGEVDFFDVVLNRRILVVLLPAMEKSTDELANLGKIIVACLKQMMATGLGNVLEGDYMDVIETKPTTSPAPYMCILDEYGYYVVKGASVMPAQARSLGFCMVFAGQDYPAFKKNNNAEEAVSTIGNCNIKIFMKLEDPTETYDLAEKSMGKGNYGSTSGLARNVGGLGNGYQDQQNANIQRRERADWLDFKDHREGEAHIIFKSTLVRANMFFADAPKVKNLQLNSLLRVEPPHHSEIQEWDELLDEMQQKILGQTQIQEMIAESLENIPARLGVISTALKQHTDPQTCGLIALGAIHSMAQQNAQSMSEKTKQVSLESLAADLEYAEEDPTSKMLHIFRKDLEEEEDDDTEEDNIWKQLRQGHMTLDDSDDEEEDEDDEDEDSMLLDERSFRRNMERVEQSMGISPEESAERSESIANDMRLISAYPKTSLEQLDPDEFTDFIEELDAQLDPTNIRDE